MKTISSITIAVILVAGSAAVLWTSPADNSALITSLAPYRDGLHHGKFTAARGLEPHPALGRWSANADRRAFVAGYRDGYSEVVAANSQANRATSAAFRDGLFMGALAVQRGQARIPAGRWASDSDRDLFTQGYWQAYSAPSLDETARNIRTADFINNGSE